MDNNKIKAIIFDVDGVIFKAHDENGDYLWSSAIKKDLGLTSEHFSIIFSEKWIDIIRGKRDLDDHLQVVFQAKLFQDLGILPKQYIDYWLSHDYNINQDILDLVESLEIPCYLGTNQESLRTSHILKFTAGRFKGYFASYEIGFIKPEQEFFQHIENALSLRRDEILLIDDMKENIDGAQNCGWQVYHYQNDIEGLKKFLQSQSVGV